MNNLDHISECLKTISGLKYLNSLMRIRNPGFGILDGKNFGSGIQDENIQIQDKHPGCATLLRRWLLYIYFKRVIYMQLTWLRQLTRWSRSGIWTPWSPTSSSPSVRRWLLFYLYAADLIKTGDSLVEERDLDPLVPDQQFPQRQEMVVI